jgi:hypothetical protein
MRHYLRLAAAAFAVGATALVLATVASADPNGSKNSFSGMANCTNGVSGPFVVNSANGQGQGAQNNNTAEWTPAHLGNGNLIFHPAVFDLTFSFTPAGGTTESFTNTDARPNAPAPVTCTIDGTQTDPAGDTFSLDGTVAGWFS